MRFIIIFSLIFLIVGPASSQVPAKKKTTTQPSKTKPATSSTNTSSKPCGEARWTGTLTFEAIYAGEIGKSERHVVVNFNSALPTLYRNIQTTDLTFTDDKGNGSATYHGEEIIAGKRISQTDCSGSGQTELHIVVVDTFDKIYEIHAIGPECLGTSVSLLDGSTTPYGPEMTDITVSDKPLGPNWNLLAGTETTVTDLGAGSVTKTTSWNLTKTCPPWNDSYTQKRMSTILERARGPLSKFINRVNNDLCIQLRVAQAFRTKAEQDELYAQGRTKPGKIVTNAPGGKSNHNFGLAVDVYMVNCDGTIDLNNKVPPGVVKIAKEEGLEWGGDWRKFKDYPHFEMK